MSDTTARDNQGSVSLPVGLCSRKRAEYLMMSASVAGGAIYVDLDLGLPGFEELVDQWGPFRYLCVGRLPNGEAVPTELLEADAVIGALKVEVDRLTKLAARHGSLADVRDEVKAVLASLKKKLQAAS